MANVDRVLLYGGFAGANATTSDDTWEYNPATNTWTQICTGCAPGARHAHKVALEEQETPDAFERALPTFRRIQLDPLIVIDRDVEER